MKSPVAGARTLRLLERVLRRTRAPAAKGGLDFVQVLAAMGCAQRVQGAVGVIWPEQLGRYKSDPVVRLLGDAQRQAAGVPRWDGMDQRPRRVVDPVDVFWLVVGRGEGQAAVQLFRQGQGPTVPEGDVA